MVKSFILDSTPFKISGLIVDSGRCELRLVVFIVVPHVFLNFRSLVFSVLFLRRLLRGTSRRAQWLPVQALRT